MRNRFDRQLEQLNNELIQMGSMIEHAIEMAVSALVNQDTEKAKEAMAYDVEIDHQERDIESLCMKLLLQQQPVARDLRLISAALKMITDMERIGDHAGDISEMTLLMSDEPYIISPEEIQGMAKETTDMVIKSIDAFVKRDMELAKKVIAQDDVVDDLFMKVKQDLIQMINKSAENGEQAADILMVAKYFERIGDHATNIAEWVIYSITGKHVEYMRPPFGIWQRRLELDLEVMPVIWSIDPLDWTTENVDEIVNKVVTEAEENDIILLHDCYDSSVDAALRIVDILMEKGFEFVTVDELILD